MPKLFKKPSESDLSDNKKLTPTQTVRALYSAQWKFYNLVMILWLKLVSLNLLLS